MTVGKSSNGNYAVALATNLRHGTYDAVEAVGECYSIIDEERIPECDWERIDGLEQEARRNLKEVSNA